LSNRAYITLLQIKERLKESGYDDVWIDTEKLCGQIDEEMAKAVDWCDIMIFCVSVAYGKSENCLSEIRLAKDKKKLRIPVKVRAFKSGEISKALGKCLWFMKKNILFNCNGNV